MNLRELAALDHAAILTDTAQGFAVPLVVTNPAGVAVMLAGYASDVAEIVDPENGLQISGRRATVSFLPTPLTAAGLGEVRVVAESDSKPWLVSFVDARGISRTYKVIEVLPDNDLGSIRCALEAYRTSA